MRWLRLAVFALVCAGSGHARTPGDLSDQAVLTRGWSEHLDKIGAHVDVAEIVIRPEAIGVQACAAAGGARIDRWRVSKGTILSVTVHTVRAPQAERPPPVADIKSGLFAVLSAAIDGPWAMSGSGAHAGVAR
ncbi:MAG: hypothetical protein NT037_06990 [Hyphomicrobiales bacterium]|jgi:hypothetical protein|nr:hypothetical protein [Hyphomicrobiales bacterium]